MRLLHSTRWLLCAWSLVQASATFAADRLAWTGAVTQVEGAAGGGLVPWALIAGLGTRDQLGASAFATYIDTRDFSLRSAGAALGIRDVVEISVQRQRFDSGSVIAGSTLGQDIVGLKVRLAGDAVFAPDSWLPQFAAGLQAKWTRDYDFIPRAVGARKGHDVDYYIAATKLYFAAVNGRNLLVNATLRATRANQFGLLGFGGEQGKGYRIEPEGSTAIFLREELLAGVEYRAKPDGLASFHEDDAFDVFIAWNPAKVFTLTAAWVNLGRIAGKPAQKGLYVSGWFGM